MKSDSSGSDYSHVQCLIDRLPADFTEEQRVYAEEFMRSRSQVFSRSEFDIGRTDVLHHRIDRGDNVPHFERLRRHPTCQLPVIDDHVEDMLRHDVIEPAASPWCSNVVTVRKKDGSMRFCIDYRKTNDLIKKDKFPLSKIDTCLGMPPTGTQLRELPDEARVLTAQWESLLLRDDVLYRRFHHPDGSTRHLQVLLPGSLRRKYVEELHAELGHFGQYKTRLTVLQRAYFPGWRSFTNLVVRNCTVCNQSQRSMQAPRQTALRPMREFRPMAVLHADLIGPVVEGKNSREQRGFQ